MRWGIIAVFMALPALAQDEPPVDVDAALSNIPDVCRNLEDQRYNSRQELFEMGVCYGFVRGAWPSDGAGDTCIGAQKAYDLALIFNAFVRRYPVWRTRSPRSAFVAAMRDAFPCSNE